MPPARPAVRSCPDKAGTRSIQFHLLITCEIDADLLAGLALVVGPSMLAIDATSIGGIAAGGRSRRIANFRGLEIDRLPAGSENRLNQRGAA